MFQTKVAEKIKTHILDQQLPPPPEHLALNEIMWKKYVKSQITADDNIKRHMRFACCIRKSTHKLSACVLHTAFPLQQWLRERASMLLLLVHSLFFLELVLTVMQSVCSY